MSERETIRAALLILSQQLTQLTFPPPILNLVTLKHDAHDLTCFLANFEAILAAIKTLTHGTVSSSVRKTMLQSQLRGPAAAWAWDAEFAEMDYEEFKEALKRQWG